MISSHIPNLQSAAHVVEEKERVSRPRRRIPVRETPLGVLARVYVCSTVAGSARYDLEVAGYVYISDLFVLFLK